MSQPVDVHDLGSSRRFRAERGQNGWLYVTTIGGEIVIAMQPAEWLDLFTLLAPFVVRAAQAESSEGVFST